jgi:two-component system response regulator VicR
MAKIMVVDDEPEMVFLIKKILEEGGHEVETANSGQEALDKLESGSKPDLILLDVMMPGLNGWEVSRKIKEKEDTKDIIVAMLTIKSEDEDKITSLDEGLADWHISKPFRNEELLRTVNWLLERPIKRES